MELIFLSLSTREF